MFVVGREWRVIQLHEEVPMKGSRERLVVVEPDQWASYHL